ncbi:MAG: MATE family efflux transporter [Oscillibacter sp.]|nr:MATE family efflux transporter [Oscillibacter sp.]
MIVDSVIVGRGVGVEALAAVGASDWVNWMMLWTMQGIALGFSVHIAQAFGARDYAGIRKAAAMLVLLCVVLGVVLTVVGQLMIEPLLRLLRTEELIYGGARLYLRVLFFGNIPVLAYNTAAGVLRCLGDSRSPLISIAVAAVINISLDLLFVMVFHWGIFGAALATVLAQTCALLYCLLVMRRIPELQIRKEDWRVQLNLLQKLCRLGLPLGVQYGTITIGGMVVQFALNRIGFVYVAAFAAVNKLIGIMECTAIAFGSAMTAYMGQNGGARRIDRIDSGIRAVRFLSLVFSSAIGGGMILFGRGLLGWFVSTEELHAAEVIEVAYQYLFVLSFALPSLFLLHAYRSSVQGLGNIKVSAITGAIEIAMRAGLAVTLPRFFGPTGIFFSEFAAWSGAGLFSVVYYYCNIGPIKRRLTANAESLKIDTKTVCAEYEKEG